VTHGEILVLATACVSVGVTTHFFHVASTPVGCAALPVSAAPRRVDVELRGKDEDGDLLRTVPPEFRMTEVYRKLDAACQATRPDDKIRPLLSYVADHDNKIFVECWSGGETDAGVVREEEFLWHAWAELPVKLWAP
jgi:hypothetical protein